MIDDGEFGRPYYLEGDYDYGRRWKMTDGWRGELDYYSVVLGGAVHMVDLLLWLTGGSVVEVGAVGSQVANRRARKFRFDDLVVATLSFEAGMIAKVGANFACVHPHFHGVKVFGTEATFVNGLGPARSTAARPGRRVEEPLDAAYPGVEKGDLIPEFVASIRGEAPARVTADEVFEAMAVCFAIDEAAAAETASASSPSPNLPGPA